MLARNPKRAARKAAETFAATLIREHKAGKLSFGAAVARCSACVSPEVGAAAFRIFKREVKR